MNKPMLDFYSNYLLSSFDRTTATSGARLTNNTISHDRITRFLNDEPSSRNLWQHVKRIVQEIQSADGVLSVDDMIVLNPESQDIFCGILI